MPTGTIPVCDHDQYKDLLRAGARNFSADINFVRCSHGQIYQRPERVGPRPNGKLWYGKHT